MKAAILTLLLVLCPQAWAQVALPSCWPSHIRGQGANDFVIRETDTAIGVGWRCGTEPSITFVRVCRLKSAYGWQPSVKDVTGIGAARILWNANVHTTCQDEGLREVDWLLIQALRE